MKKMDRERRTSFNRDFSAASIQASTSKRGDLDPMSGLANLVDVMLVFACGLLLALVVSYGVDLSTMETVTPTGDMEQVDNTEEITRSQEEGGKGYEEMGMAYRDPETGQLYIEVVE